MFLVNLGPNTSLSAPNWCRDCLTMESTTYSPGTLYSGLHYTGHRMTRARDRKTSPSHHSSKSNVSHHDKYCMLMQQNQYDLPFWWTFQQSEQRVYTTAKIKGGKEDVLTGRKDTMKDCSQWWWMDGQRDRQVDKSNQRWQRNPLAWVWMDYTALMLKRCKT